MKKSIKFMLSLLLVSILEMNVGVSQNISFNWAVATGSNVADQVHGIDIDAQGNVYVCGQFQGIVDFDNGPGTSTLTSQGGNDVFIAKYNSSGNLQWARSVGGSSGEIGRSIKLDVSGNIWVCGNFAGVVDLDPGPGVTSYTSGFSDAFILKLNNSGNYIWSGVVAGNGMSVAYKLKIDSPGNVIVAGTYSNTANDFDPGAGTATLTASNYDGFVLKLDNSGVFQWVKRIGGIGVDEIRGLDIDANNNIVAGGYYSADIDLDPGPGTATFAMLGSYDGFCVKLDGSGNYSWGATVGGSQYDAAGDVSIDAFGNVYVVGNFGAIADFDPSPSVFNLTPNGNWDVYVTKYNSTGAFLWAKKIGGAQFDYGFVVESDLTGVYIGASYGANVDLDPGAGTYTVPFSGIEDVFTTKLDVNGNFLWGLNLSSNQTERISAIEVDALGGVYLGGSYGNTIDINPTAGTQTVTNAAPGTDDLYLIKLCQQPASPINLSVTNGTQVCSGKSATLQASASGTVVWYTSPSGTTSIGSGTQLVTSTLTAGQYSFYAAANTCMENPVRTLVQTTVHVLPSLSAVSSGSICQGSSATLTANGSDTYSWSSGATSSSVIVTPSVTSIYTITGTSSLTACEATFTLTQVVVVCSGLSELASEMMNFKMYPNPMNQYLMVEVDDISSISFYHMNGTLVKELEVPSGISQIDLSGVPVGVYLTKIKNKYSLSYGKIIKLD